MKVSSLKSRLAMSVLAVLSIVAGGGGNSKGGASACASFPPKRGPVLATVSTTTDPNLLQGEIDTYRYNEGSLPVIETQFVTIDLSTGRVTPGKPPNGVSLTAAPRAEADQTFGYRVIFQNATQKTLLFAPNGTVVASVSHDDSVGNCPPFVSDSRLAVADEDNESLFVSKKLDRAYLQFDTLGWDFNGILIIQPSNGEVIQCSKSTYTIPRGFTSDLFDDLQILKTNGDLTECHGASYVSYNETSLQTSISMESWQYNRGNISEALLAVENVGGETNHTLKRRAYIARNRNRTSFSDGGVVQLFSVEVIDLSTGDVIGDPVVLNIQDLTAISDGTYSKPDTPPGGSSSPACFSKHNLVELRPQSAAKEDVQTMELSDLKIGDYVRTGPSSFSRVYGFGHFDPTATVEYIQIHYSLTTSGTTNNDSNEQPPALEITSDHMVFVVKHDGTKQAVPASTVQIGDELIFNRPSTVFTSKNSFKQQQQQNANDVDVVIVTNLGFVTRATGAYAPFTEDGTIVVSGVVASCYVSMQPLLEGSSGGMLQIGGWTTPFSMQWLAHLVTAPRRAVCSFFMSSICQREAYNTAGIATWVVAPFNIARWMLQEV